MAHSLSSPEQEKIASLFNKFGVDYIATGDYAMRKYVDHKYFQNIQLWVKPSPDNYQKVSDALASVRRKFDVDEKSFTTENAANALIKIGRGRKGVELYTGVPGMTANDFNKAFADRKVLNAGHVPIPILNERDLHKTLEKSHQLSQRADVPLLERAMPKLNSSSRKGQVPVIDWKEAARTLDPHKLLTDLGFSHIPAKGFLGSSTSQTYERGAERITVYPNKEHHNAIGKPFFIDQKSGKKGDAIDFLNWQHNYDRKEVNRSLEDHFGGFAPTPLSTIGSPTKKRPEQEPSKPDAKAIAEWQQKELKEKYGLKTALDRPEYLQSRGLSLQTIFRPEFFKQVLNSLGWSSKQQQTVNIDNTVFPLRNDQGITSMIIRNTDFKGFPGVERHDSVWLSNPPLSLAKDLKISQGGRQIILPKGTEGTLIPAGGKPGTYQFYYLDPYKEGKELNFNKLEVAGSKLEQLTKALNPLKVDRLVVTESPIDAMSLHQLAPPKSGETRMYISTGGQPSAKQVAYINQLVQRIRPSQIVMGNDNEKAGYKFNINLMGAIQPTAGEGQKQFLARLGEIKHPKDANGHTPAGEFQLKVFGAKEPAFMEKVAHRITDAINRFTPKGVEPPARITLLNGSADAGSEATIAFPLNERFLLTAQKQLEKIINEQAPAKEMQLVKVVKPLSKDFNEDLKQSQAQKTKVNYDLDKIPQYMKSTATNLYHQISGYTNNAFDALFGGIPGSLPRMESARSRKETFLPRIEKTVQKRENPAPTEQLSTPKPQAALAKSPPRQADPGKKVQDALLAKKNEEAPQSTEAVKGLPKIPLERKTTKIQAEGLPLSASQGIKNNSGKPAEKADIKAVARVDLGFVRGEVKPDVVIIGKDSKGQLYEGVKGPAAHEKVLWKSEMSPVVKDLLRKDQVVFKFEPQLETGEKITYGKDLSGNYFHTKNEYAIEVGLKQQWTRLAPKEGKLMEFGPSQQQTTVKIPPNLPGKVTFDLADNEARAVSFALHHYLKKNDETSAVSPRKSHPLWDLQENFEAAIKKTDPAAADNTRVVVAFNPHHAKEIEKAVKEVLTTANPRDVFLFKPDELFQSLRSGHESIKQSIGAVQKAKTTLTDGPQQATETKLEQAPQKVTKFRI